MRKTLTYSSFAVSTLVVVVVFVTATTYLQLAAAVLLYPLIAFFAFKILPLKTQKAPTVTIPMPVESIKKVWSGPDTESEKHKNISVSDIDKRAFLKLIGAAGLSLFLSSIFIRKSGLFGGSTGGVTTLESTAGKKIDPAESHPMDGYRISEIADNDLSFYGFTNKDGNWFIMKEDPEAGSFRYTKGESSFSSSWTKRENLKYDYFHNIFSEK